MTLYCKYSKTSPKVHLHDSLALAEDTRKYWKILLPAAFSDAGITIMPTSFPRRISTASRNIQSIRLKHLLGLLLFHQTTVKFDA